jgi:epoxide hydrolase 4
MKEGYMTVNGVRLHYVEEGEGPLVILLHGFPDFWYGWRKQIPVLSGKYRVVVPDMRGYNLSEKPTQVRDYRLDVLAADIFELIQSFGVGQALVAGHDWGGAVAWALAARYPQAVAKLAALNAPHPEEMKKTLRGFDVRQLRKSYYAFLFQLPGIPEWTIGRNLVGFFRRIFGMVLPATELDAVMPAYVEAYSHAGALRASISYYRAAMRYMSDLALPAIRHAMPVLMLWGEQDTLLGKELADRTDEYCDDLEIVCDPGSGHWVQIENPDLVNAKLMEFFERP